MKKEWAKAFAEMALYGIMLGLVIVFYFSFSRQVEYIYGGL